MSLATIILAAGMGKRMNDLTKPKVLFAVKGKPMLEYVVERAIEIGSEKIIIIVGFHREMVAAFIKEKFSHISGIEFAVQEEQLGTGHAVSQAKENLKDFSGNIVILSGDVPLLTTETLEKFQNFHREGNFTASLISCKLDNPFGYGRIVRDEDDSFQYIREQKDANDREKAVNEVNSGIYMVKKEELFETLSKIGNHNAGGEYYLTDIFQILSESEHTIGAYTIQSQKEITGANTQEQLKELEEMMN